MESPESIESWDPTFNHRDVQLLLDVERYSGFCSIKNYTLKFRLFKGGWSSEVTREFLDRAPAVAVLVYHPMSDSVVLIEQIRVGAMNEPHSPWLLEIVAGMIDENEKPEACATREAIEEAGCTVESLIPICTYWVSPGASNEKTSVYCGIVKSLPEGNHFFGLAHEHEDIKIHIMEAKAAFKLVKTGKIVSASAVIALQWLELNHDHASVRDAVQ